jgi:hypothetical protein
LCDNRRSRSDGRIISPSARSEISKEACEAISDGGLWRAGAGAGAGAA